ncbi:MAG: methyltransferase [Oscillospiraceae bacterium]|nr:methyltransferase [Oscillospiraceae bacterium]
MLQTERLGPYLLSQREGLPKVSRDSLLLAEFVTLHRGDRVLDLGCGVGVLGICLAGRKPDLTLDGLELQPECAVLARENLSANGLSGRIWEGRVEEIRSLIPAGGYDLILCNPPYFQTGRGATAAGSRGVARTIGSEGLAPWCGAARWGLKNGGRFALCCRPETLGELMVWLSKDGLTPKRMQLIQTAEEKKPNLVLLEAMAQGRPGLEVLPVRIVR